MAVDLSFLRLLCIPSKELCAPVIPLSRSQRCASTYPCNGHGRIVPLKWLHGPRRGATVAQFDSGDSSVKVLPSIAPDVVPLVEFLERAEEFSTTSEELVASLRELQFPAWRGTFINLCASKRSVTARKLLTVLQTCNVCGAESIDLLCAIVITGLSKESRPEDAMLLFDQLKQIGGTLGPKAFNAIVGTCARENQHEEALELLDQMRSAGFQPDNVNYSLVFQACAKKLAGVVVIARVCADIRREGLEMDTKLYNDVIHAFCCAGDPDKALQYMDLMQACDLCPDVRSYTTLIETLVVARRIYDAEAAYAEMKSKSLKINLRTLNALLAAYTRHSLLEQVEQLLRDAEDSGLKLSTFSYGLLIDAYSRAGRLEQAKEMFQSMKNASVQANAFIYSRLMVAYRNARQWDGAIRLLKEMYASKVKPNQYVFNILIDTYGKFGRLPQAMRVFAQMNKEGVKPDVVTWNSLIEAHCRATLLSEALALLKQMQERNCTPSLHTYNIILNALGWNRRWKEMAVLLDEMQSKGLNPNEVTYTTLVDIYGTSKRYREASEYLNQMKEQGLQPTTSVYCALANAYAKQVSSLVRSRYFSPSGHNSFIFLHRSVISYLSTSGSGVSKKSETTFL
jgi:pentatricopeptide repeat protein